MSSSPPGRDERSIGDIRRHVGASCHRRKIFVPVARLRWVVVSAFPSVKLHVVTGKGGTGKTTVAAALALALAAGGREVLLTEVEGRQGIAQLFDTPPMPYEERKVAVARGAGEVYALAVDPEAALREYIEMFYNLKRAGSALT